MRSFHLVIIIIIIIIIILLVAIKLYRTESPNRTKQLSTVALATPIVVTRVEPVVRMCVSSGQTVELGTGGMFLTYYYRTCFLLLPTQLFSPLHMMEKFLARILKFYVPSLY